MTHRPRRCARYRATTVVVAVATTFTAVAGTATVAGAANGGRAVTSLPLSFDRGDPAVIEAFALNKRSTFPDKSRSLNTDDIATPKAKVANSPDVELVYELHKKLTTGGMLKRARVVGVTDVQFYKDILAVQQRVEREIRIPEKLEKHYTTPEAGREVTKVLHACRTSYVAYLKHQRVHRSYLAAMDKLLPPDFSTLEYRPVDNPQDSQVGFVQLRPDGTYKFVLNASGVHFVADQYDKARLLSRAELGDDGYYRSLRDLSVSATCFHEFTHILQYAADRVNRGSWKYPDAAGDIRLIPKTLKNLYRDDSAVTDRAVGDANLEAIAEGISFEMTAEVFDLSPKQKTQLWDFSYGRLKRNRARVNEFIGFVFDRYEESLPIEVIGPLDEWIFSDDGPLRDFEFREKNILSNLLVFDPDAWAGYLNPTIVSENAAIWSFLRQPHTRP